MSVARELDVEEVLDRVGAGLQNSGIQATVAKIERIPAGLSSLTYRLELKDGALPLVLKAATPGLVPTKNRDIIRQARIISYLNGIQGVPTPTVIFTDSGEPPETPPIFAMSYIAGESCEPLDDENPSSATELELYSRYLQAARTLGRLHSVSITDAVFESEPTEDGGGELRKWGRAFRSVPEDLQGDFERCERLLSSNIPEPQPAALIHGDYRLGNMICRGGDVAAIIDWEIWGLGDPRCDLAWLLHMSDPHVETAQQGRPFPPARQQLIDEYVASRGRDVSDLAWFDALALFKRAAATALIVKHSRRSATPDPRKLAAARVIAPLLDLAVSTLQEG
ncbi:phosphotransferase family protein [Rhodococcus sp. NPDC056960]|uniref:phosphotransferase family protein n=1 Tax=Rhodococcus TaxID=1827 RepID=UPI003630613D